MFQRVSYRKWKNCGLSWFQRERKPEMERCWDDLLACASLAAPSQRRVPDVRGALRSSLCSLTNGSSRSARTTTSTSMLSLRWMECSPLLGNHHRKEERLWVKCWLHLAVVVQAEEVTRASRSQYPRLWVEVNGRCLCFGERTKVPVSLPLHCADEFVSPMSLPGFTQMC